MTSFNASSYTTMSNYVEPLARLFNVETGDISLIFTIHALTSLVFSLLLGKILKKVSVKLTVAVGAFAYVAFFVSVFFANSLPLVYIGVGLNGISFVLSGLVIGQTIVTWWAEKNTGRAVSYLPIGFSIMSFIISPLIANGIINYGVRTTALVQGLICFTVIILADIFLIPERPEYYGIKAETKSEEAEDLSADVPAKAVYRTYPFWCIVTAIALFNLAFNGFNNNAAVFYQSIGVDAVQAAYGVSIYSMISVAWSYLHGFMTDKKGPALSNGVCTLVGAAIFFAATMLRGFTGVVIIALLLGSMSVGGTVGGVTFPYVFGKKRAGFIIGFGMAAASAGSTFGAPIAAHFYDTTGSYNTYLYIAAAAMALSMILVMLGSNKKAVKTVEKAAAKYAE